MSSNRYIPILSTLSDWDTFPGEPWDVLDTVSGLILPLTDEGSANDAAGYLNHGIADPDYFSWVTSTGDRSRAPSNKEEES